MPTGRSAPSPSGDLHIGNLRTAVLAWLFARSSGRGFVLRVDDLDRVRPGAQQRQLADLASIGIDWDAPVLLQSERRQAHDEAIDRLVEQGRTFECFCTRREVQDAPSAPHRPPGAYPGTCRALTEAQRARRRTERPPAIRLRSGVDSWTVVDQLHGPVTTAVDDLVLRRNDGVAAYNLTVVVDDARQTVDQVVRADDLLSSTPRQAYLAHLLGLEPPAWAHVPLVVNRDGTRLSKRDGAVTAAELRERGAEPLALIAASLGLRAGSITDLLDQFDPERLPRRPWVFTPPVP